MDYQFPLIVENVTLTLSGKTLLNNINFALPKGKITALIGPNGAGKSSLIKVLSGYLKPQKGQCVFHAKPLLDFSTLELAKWRAVMRQNNQINFAFSVEEVIRMGAYHRCKKEIAIHLEEVIKLTDCESLRRKFYHQLSGGEQQRTQLARVLLQLWSENMSGKILFLDEPTSALDLYHQQHCLRLLTALCREKNLTVCTVLHDLNLVSLYADQLILLAQNKVQVKGNANEVITENNIHQWYNAEIITLPHLMTKTPQLLFKK
ncbi:heme ABC transporter ATP-binding protein [Seminibacterium arietis]|uniref:Heme ABC transporter ATP-binding protein n=1 Tax=Seminibacterium arietis TaxID=1173502 RepID=A0ABW3IAX8_9PAST